jgi:hypothetical protein
MDFRSFSKGTYDAFLILLVRCVEYSVLINVDITSRKVRARRSSDSDCGHMTRSINTDRVKAHCYSGLRARKDMYGSQ